MSGATAAHASYNGSGTQGLAVTNKINDTGDIMSVFWTKDKTTKQLLHGCSLIEIPASGGGETPGSNLTFTMNSDMDVIGDLYLHVTLKLVAGCDITKEYGLLNLFDRIEFQCGTQIWQTLEFADILALNTTELSEGAYEKFILSTHGYYDASGGVITAPASQAGGPTDTDFDLSANETRAFSLRLPMLTRNLAPMLNNYSNISESGFLTAAAPNQTVKIKVYTNKAQVMSDNAMISGTHTGADRMEIRLFGKHMIMCNEEREKIRNIPGGLAKRLKLTQYRDALNPTIDSATNMVNIELDCDHFSLYASHIIIQLFDNSTYVKSTDNYKLEQGTGDKCATLVTADLKLNSTSFCGKITGGMMSGPLAESMGLYVNNFFSRTDPHTRTILYVFPLANKAYSGSGVPLNRFDNIRLSLKIFVPSTIATTAKLYKVSATCVGETTALYKQGAASISMY
jgi:hypothetical protein